MRKSDRKRGGYGYHLQRKQIVQRALRAGQRRSKGKKLILLSIDRCKVQGIPSTKLIFKA